MATAGLSKVLQRLRQALPDSVESDTQLLARFVAGRDEAAFEALLRRHGSMVLAVCRRVLGHVHDAEDAFQAAFLILARKAGSVARADSLGCWLHRVAYRVALEARAGNARRAAREKLIGELPEVAVAPAEPQDWRPLLDEELNRLPQKYREAVVLCELEGKPRREAAALLGVPEGTLSSRLASARKLLAGRLARRGVLLSAAALTAALAQGGSQACVPAALVGSTARVAVLVASGLEGAAVTPAAILMKGVLKAMFLTRLKLVVAVVMVAAALGAGGFAYQAGGGQSPARADNPPAKPRSEQETLRKENELLKLNLEIVLEKVRAQDAEIRTLKAQAAQAKKVTVPLNSLLDSGSGLRLRDTVSQSQLRGLLGVRTATTASVVDPMKQVEDALKALREAKDPAAKRRAIEALEQAAKKLRELHKEAGKPAAGGKR
jgi:RNA polymerase sigma factor (sigma-70 family)